MAFHDGLLVIREAAISGRSGKCLFHTSIIRRSSVCQEHILRRRFLAYNRALLSACVIGCEERGVKTANGKIQKEQDQTEAQPDGA